MANDKRKSARPSGPPAGKPAMPGPSAKAARPAPPPPSAPEPVTASPSPVVRPKPWILVVLGAVALLVVFEVSVLFKGKADRQRTLTQIGSLGERGGAERPEAFHGALTMRIDDQDRLLLVDSDWKKVVVWDAPSGRFLFSVDAATAGSEQFNPAVADAAPDGTLFVLDRAAQRVYVFDAQGGPTGSWAAPNAASIAVAPNGEVVASDNNKMQLVRYNAAGQELGRIGGPGTGRGRLSLPYHLDVDAKGIIYLIDQGNKRIQAFVPQGKALAEWPLKFNPTIIIGVTAWNDEVYVNDFENSQIWVYTPRGRLIGQIKMYYPSNLAIDSQGRFYLPTNAGIGRYVQKTAQDKPQTSKE